VSKLSNAIESFIKKMLQNTENQTLEIRRNELADYFSCAPSQINYVLSTRFSIHKGYYVESRRGGGGYIRITKISIDEDDLLHTIFRIIGNSISQSKSEDIIERLREEEVISDREGEIMKAAVNKKNLNLPVAARDKIRANILKAMIACLMRQKSE